MQNTKIGNEKYKPWTQNGKQTNMQNLKWKTHRCQFQFESLDVLYALQYQRKSWWMYWALLRWSAFCIVKYKAKRTTVQGAVRKGENRAKLLCTPLTRNAIFEKILMDVLHRLHPRRVYTVNYKGKFRKRANGRRVRKAPGLKYAACAQK